MATWSNLLFQNSVSPLMEQLIFFHDHTMLILIMITSLIVYMFAMLMNNSFSNRFLMEGQEIETIWTLLPAVILIFIALPSLRLLYLLDEVSTPALTLKTIGHQWYWSYEYSDFSSLEFDSFMLPWTKNDQFRLLDVDNHTFLPINTHIRVLITAADVLHAWTMPALGIKMDAVPGRLNQASFLMNRPGLWYGQCSEICGANHSFMPIVLESTPLSNFTFWLKSQLK